MKIDSDDYRVVQGKKVKLEDLPTNVKHIYHSKKQYRKLLDKNVEQLSDLQRLHYASNRHALLLIFRVWTPQVKMEQSGMSCLE